MTAQYQDKQNTDAPEATAAAASLKRQKKSSGKVNKVSKSASAPKCLSVKQTVENILTCIANSSELKRDTNVQFFLKSYRVDLRALPFELLREVAAAELKNLRPVRSAKPGKSAAAKTPATDSADLSQSEDEEL